MPHTLGQRIKAAKELGGYESLDSLARAVNLTNLSAKSLRRSANDERTPQDHELDKIAEACGLTPAFFTVDFGRLPELEQPAETATPAPASASDLTALQEQVALIAAQVTALAAAALPPSEEAPAATGDPQQRQRP